MTTETAIDNDHSLEILYRNLEEYGLFNPVLAIEIAEVECDDYVFCYTHLGELNLRKDSKKEKKSVYYHSVDGARIEANQWYRSIEPKLNETRRLILFGIGIGYYYDTIKNWLQKNPDNMLIVIEDDLAVLRRFFETEKATKVLSDPQVIICYFDSSASDIVKEFNKRINYILQSYISGVAFLSSLALYSKWKENLCVLIRDQIFSAASWFIVMMNEARDPDQTVFKNYYSNVIRQYVSYSAYKIKDRFKGVPALICGAGPSIIKDIEVIRKLQDKAIIIASGTGMNVLNHYGINPHFGTGVDPTRSQGTRIRTNFAYETPIFYKTRFHADSFKLVHAPKIFYQKFSGYSIAEWFESRAGVKGEIKEEEGISSTNFSMEIAKHLGCDPIILVGVDLAYTDASRYPRIISEHPADPPHSKQEIVRQSDTPIIGHTCSGELIHSKLEWFQEALCFIKFMKNNPDRTYLNATVEGLGIRDFKYMPLKNIEKEYFKKTWDLHSWIHTEIQNSFGDFSKQASEDAFDEWKGSLERCSKIFKDFTSELKTLWGECQEGKRLPSAPYNGRISLLEADLSDEPVAKYLLAENMTTVDVLSTPAKIFYRCHGHRLTDVQKDIKKLEIDINYITFFNHVINVHERLIKDVLDEYHAEEKALSLEETKKWRKENQYSEDVYEFKDGILRIEDKELGIDFKDTFNPQTVPKEAKVPLKEGETLSDVFITCHGELAGEYMKYYEDGTLLADYYYHNGQLHGPVKYYHPSGQLMSLSWYVDGLKQGKIYRYYPSGSLFGILRYKDGLEHGLHEYFYEDGSYKSEIHYEHGRLDGEVTLYYVNGRKKRFLNFKEGKLDGIEYFWGPDGFPIWEAFYRQGKPYGKARAWHANHALLREYTYFEDQKHYNYQEWDKEGNLRYEETNIAEDMRETEVKKRRDINEAIQKFQWDIERIERMTKHEKKQLFY